MLCKLPISLCISLCWANWILYWFFRLSLHSNSHFDNINMCLLSPFWLGDKVKTFLDTKSYFSDLHVFPEAVDFLYLTRRNLQMWLMIYQLCPYEPHVSRCLLRGNLYIWCLLKLFHINLSIVLSSSMQSRTYPIILQMMWKPFDFIYLMRESLHVKFTLSNLSTKSSVYFCLPIPLLYSITRMLGSWTNRTFHFLPCTLVRVVLEILVLRLLFLSFHVLASIKTCCSPSWSFQWIHFW